MKRLWTTELVAMKFHQKADYDSICDMDGIPMLDYKGAIGPQYNPIAIAQWGLGNYNLLPGQANIYYKGSSVGETYLNTKSTKNIISISLGRDRSFKAKSRSMLSILYPLGMDDLFGFSIFVFSFPS